MWQKVEEVVVGEAEGKGVSHARAFALVLRTLDFVCGHGSVMRRLWKI